MVSLVPSLTETLFDIGAGKAVVGVTNFCIFPPTDLPKLGGTKNPRVDEIRALEPDLVYVNLEENLPRHAEAIDGFAPVFATYPKTVGDVTNLIRLLGEIHDVRDRAAEVSDAIDQCRGDAVRRPFTFAVPIWKDPWMWCGGDTYVSDLVCSVGGRNVLAHEQRYPSHPLDDVVTLQPDIIFLPDEPYVFTEADGANLRTRDAGRGTLDQTHVVGPFPGHLFTWHGSRTLLGLQFLKQALSQ